MDHYLVVLVQDRSKQAGFCNQSSRPEGDDPASLLAFDLLDHSVQEAEIDVRLFADEEHCGFTKLGENQILKFYIGTFVCVTVESFKRMLSV